MSTDSSPTPGPLTSWSNTRFPEAVFAEMVQAVQPHRLVVQPTDAADSRLAEADVAFGQPDPRQVIESQRLRWVHLTTAGYTHYDNAEVRNALLSRGGILTNSSSVYDDPCAQHVLAMMMTLARHLPRAWTDQNGPRNWVQSPMRGHSRLLNGQTAILFGFGAIGRRLAELLSPLRMNLIGVRRSPRGGGPIPVVSTDAAGEWLGRADHVVNLLPGAAGTDGYFNARRVDAIKNGAIFYNIGRGSTVDQAALLSALKSGRLAAAYLDVTDPEPLPPSHPLWSAPNCYITPHSAGGHADEAERLVELFLANLRRFASGAALVDRVF